MTSKGSLSADWLGSYVPLQVNPEAFLFETSRQQVHGFGRDENVPRCCLPSQSRVERSIMHDSMALFQQFLNNGPYEMVLLVQPHLLLPSIEQVHLQESLIGAVRLLYILEGVVLGLVLSKRNLVTHEVSEILVFHLAASLVDKFPQVGLTVDISNEQVAQESFQDGDEKHEN